MAHIIHMIYFILQKITTQIHYTTLISCDDPRRVILAIALLHFGVVQSSAFDSRILTRSVTGGTPQTWYH